MLKATIPQLGDLTADVWIDERHRREMELTQNPIEFGSPITDHAFIKAQSLAVRFAVSNTPLVDNPTFSDTDRVAEARNKLYELQDSKQFLTVKTVTGGEYKNMMLTGIGWSTDSSNPHATIFDLDLEEVIIVTTQQTEYQALPPEVKTQKQTDTTKKRGELPKNELSGDDTKRKRTGTRDVSVSKENQAKSTAAEKKAKTIKKSTNRKQSKEVIKK